MATTSIHHAPAHYEAQVARPRPVALARVAWSGGCAALVAAALNSLVCVLARAGGVSLLVPLASDGAAATLPLEMVIGMSAAGALAGAAMFAVVGRLAPGQRYVFRAIALGFLFLSFAGPLGVPSVDGATRATLVLMHVVAGVATISLLERFGHDAVRRKS